MLVIDLVVSGLTINYTIARSEGLAIKAPIAERLRREDKDIVSAWGDDR